MTSGGGSEGNSRAGPVGWSCRAWCGGVLTARSGSGASAAAAARGGLGRRLAVTPPDGGEVRCWRGVARGRAGVRLAVGEGRAGGFGFLPEAGGGDGGLEGGCEIDVEVQSGEAVQGRGEHVGCLVGRRGGDRGGRVGNGAGGERPPELEELGLQGEVLLLLVERISTGVELGLF